MRVMKIVPLVLAALLIAAPTHAALIRAYDLDTLCFMSTDVVEARLIQHHQPNQKQWDGTFTATVLSTLAGKYKAGDQINSLDVELYNPVRAGQRCLLFIARKQFYFAYLQPPEAIPPQVTDMFLIDTQNRVRRYFQWSNPGGLLAEGYSISWVFPNINSAKPVAGVEKTTNSDSRERTYPTFAEERQIVASKWAAVDKLRPLLSHEPRREDAPILLTLLRERRNHREHSVGGQALEDGIAQTICTRLADLRDPSVALDALCLTDEETAFLSGLDDIPFDTDKGMAYARSVRRNVQESAARRAAAAKVIRANEVLRAAEAVSQSYHRRKKS